MHLDVHLFSSEKVKGVSFFCKKQKTHRQIKNSGGCFLINAPRGALVFQAEKLKEFPTGNLNFLFNEVRVVPFSFFTKKDR